MASGFDYFTQPQGVAIPISIFGDARSAGIKAGMESPNTVGAIAQGITGGINNYQATQLNAANIAKTEAQIQQMPTELEIKKQQLKNQEAELKLNELKVANELKTREITIKAETAKLEQEYSVNNGLNLMSDAAVAADKQDFQPFRNAFIGGQAMAAAAAYPDKALMYLQKAVDTGAMSAQEAAPFANMFTQKQQEEYAKAVGIAKAKADAAVKTKLMEQEDKNFDDLGADTLAGLQAVLARVNSDKELLASNIEIHPAGVRAYDTNKNMLPKEYGAPISGILKQQADEKNITPINYEVFDSGKFTGIVLQPSEYGKFMKWRNSYTGSLGQNIPNWSETNLDRKTRDQPEGAPQQQQQQQQPQYQTPANAAIPQAPAPSGQASYTLSPAQQNNIRKRNFSYLPPYLQSVPNALPGGITQGAYAKANEDMKAEMLKQVVSTPSSNYSNRATVSTSTAPLSSEPVPGGTRAQVDMQDRIYRGAEEKGAAPILGDIEQPEINMSSTSTETGGSGTGGGGAKGVEEEIVPESKAAASLSTVIGAPVALKTNVAYKIPAKSWTAAHSNPLIALKSALVKGVATVESGVNKNAVSPTGVVGIMQVTRATARDYGLDAKIPEQNLEAGERHLARLLSIFNGNLRLALTSYNAGQGTVLDAIKRAGTTDWSSVQRELRDSLSPSKYKEAENYADKVISAASQYVQPGRESDRLFVTLLQEQDLVTKA